MTNNRLSDIITLESGNSFNLSRFGLMFMLVGLLTQGFVGLVMGSTKLSLASGMLGVISVVLCSQKKISFYVFGFAQLITYVILCLQQNLYGEIIENIFYFVTMLYGMFHWNSHYNNESLEVKTRHLAAKQNVLVFVATALASVALFYGLLITNDTQPFMDAVTTVPAFVAQILMILRFKESWFYWFIIDLGSIIMWAIASDWCMVAQFVFWTANCVYGYYMWNKDGKV